MTRNGIWLNVTPSTAATPEQASSRAIQGSLASRLVTGGEITAASP